MRIAILGTRGIPNHYGGFEQFAEYLSVGLAARGHDVVVYNSHNHPCPDREFRGVKLVHVYDPESKIGTAGQFLYDLLCIWDTRSSHYDIILQLGYTSSSIFFGLHPRGSVVVTNMDGLEWKRTKYSTKVQKFLQWAERLAVKKSDYMISDSVGIQSYIKSSYDKDTAYIPYGAYAVEDYDVTVCQGFGVGPYGYDMLIARLEPENSIEVILGGVATSQRHRKFLVVGKHETKYGNYLKDKFKDEPSIIFVGAIYDQPKLDSLRCFSNIYFHGHTVGGTNPSLLEAMGSSALVCANNNEFNKAILGEDALYFSISSDVTRIIDTVYKAEHMAMVSSNIEKIRSIYSWEKIIDQYEGFLVNCARKGDS